LPPYSASARASDPRGISGVSGELRAMWMIDSFHSDAGVCRRGIMGVIA
jgi:hypothetical protein